MQAIDPAEVRAALEQVLASPSFVNAGRLSRMLRFVVERALDGQGDQLKEYLLGVEVFDRPTDYDPRLDSIVRVEARRLRAKLAEYYAAEGAGDGLLIRLAKGGYAPTFVRAAAAEPPSEPVGRSRLAWAAGLGALALVAVAAQVWRWPTAVPVASTVPVASVAVLPFHVFSGREEDRRVADRLADGITTELGRVTSLAVAAHTNARQFRDPQRTVREIGQALGVSVVMESTVHVDGPMVRLEVRLVDVAHGRKLWVEDFIGGGDDLDRLERDVAQAVSQYLLGRHAR